MKLNNAIRRQLVFVAAGLAVGDALICAVFALLHKFDYTVPLGAVWGSAFAFLNVADPVSDPAAGHDAAPRDRHRPGKTRCRQQ